MDHSATASAALRADVVALQADVTALRGNVASLDAQLAGIEGSLADVRALLLGRTIAPAPRLLIADGGRKRGRDGNAGTAGAAPLRAPALSLPQPATVLEGVAALRAHAARLGVALPSEAATALAAAEAGADDDALAGAFKTAVQVLALAVEAALGGADGARGDCAPVAAPRNEGGALRSSKTLLRWLTDVGAPHGGRPAASEAPAGQSMRLRWIAHHRGAPGFARTAITAAAGVSVLRAHAERIGVAVPDDDAAAIAAAEASHDDEALHAAFRGALRSFVCVLERDVCGGREVAPRDSTPKRSLRWPAPLLSWIHLHFSPPGRPPPDVAAAIATLRSESARLGVAIPSAAAAALASAVATGYDVGQTLDTAAREFTERVEVELCGGARVAPRVGRLVVTVPRLLQWLPLVSRDGTVRRPATVSSSREATAAPDGDDSVIVGDDGGASAAAARSRRTNGAANDDGGSSLRLQWIPHYAAALSRRTIDAVVSTRVGIADLRAHAARIGVGIPDDVATSITAAEASGDEATLTRAFRRAMRAYVLVVERERCGGRTVAPRQSESLATTSALATYLRSPARLLKWLDLFFHRPGQLPPELAAAVAGLRTEAARLGVAIPAAAADALASAEATGFGVGQALDAASCALVLRIEAGLGGSVPAAPRTCASHVGIVPDVLQWLRALPSPG